MAKVTIFLKVQILLQSYYKRRQVLQIVPSNTKCYNTAQSE